MGTQMYTHICMYVYIERYIYSQMNEEEAKINQSGRE